MFIAEIGINYAFGEDKSKFLQNAKELIDMAVMAKCDVVKFQKRTPELCVPKEQMNKEKIVPWRKEPTTYLQYKKDIEFGKEEYDEINRYCKQRGIKWTASVWDIPSADFLSMYKVPFVKIPSASITDYDLLDACVDLFDKIIFSTGMSTEEEIKMCYNNLIEDVNGTKTLQKNITIMHCNSSYPAKDEELNLSYIKKLKEDYPDCKIGYSGHEQGISACIISKVMGAEVFERHITLSRSNWGTDQAASLVFDQLWRLVRDLKKVDTWIGDGVKKVYPSEEPIRDKLRV